MGALQTCLVNAALRGLNIETWLSAFCPRLMTFHAIIVKKCFIGSFPCLLSVDFLSGIEREKTDAACLHGVYLSVVLCKLFSCWFFLCFLPIAKASQNGLKTFSAVCENRNWMCDKTNTRNFSTESEERTRKMRWIFPQQEFMSVYEVS